MASRAERILQNSVETIRQRKLQDDREKVNCWVAAGSD
jgi:hypothetical protein